MRTTVIVTLVLGLACGAARADMESLKRFLSDVEETTQVTAALRADGEIQVTSPDGKRRDQVVVIVRPPADLYIELRTEGIKALLPGTGNAAYILANGSKKAEPFALDASFAGSDFTREDLEPFRAGHYKEARIADDSSSELTVTLFPVVGQYSLLVTTFDRNRKLPLKTLYYRETQSNLVKMERDEGYELIGRKWVPTTLTMESFKLRTQTTFKLRWSQNPTFPPELFDPAFLPRPSGIVWPAASETPAA